MIIKLLIIIVIVGIIGTIFYTRWLAIKESKKITEELNPFCEKYSLTLDVSRKIRNEVFPYIYGDHDGRKIFIERRLQDKFKFWVLNIAIKNAENLHWQVLLKDKVQKNEQLGDAQIIHLPNPEWNSKYYLLSSDEELGIKLLDKYVHPFWDKHEQITYLLSTVIIYQQAATLVLLSVDNKIKNNILLEKSLMWLSSLVDGLEKE